MPRDAALAVVAAGDRWSDEPYAARIIVDQLTKQSRDATTGHGLMVSPSAEDEYNNNRPSIIIDLTDKSFEVIETGIDTIKVSFGDLVSSSQESQESNARA